MVLMMTGLMLTTRKYRTALLLLFSLSSLPIYADPFQDAVKAYQAGDYTKARDIWAGMSDKGDAAAQFNLGVLYENGQGLEKDLNLAQEWYRRAAVQGLPEAKKKLDALEQLETTERIQHPDVSSLPAIESFTGIKREEWVIKQHPKTYTLQLSSVVNEEDIIKFIKDNKLDNDSAYIEVEINGVTRFTAIYGVFDTYEQAQNAIKKLPGNLQQDNPWVRNFGILQELLNKR